MEQVSFKAEGFVLGNLWGGGTGAYPSSMLSAETKEEIIESAKKGIQEGSLDSGMGFQSLNGAILILTKTTRVEIDGLPFSNEQYETIFVGDLDEMDQAFLEDCLYGM